MEKHNHPLQADKEVADDKNPVAVNKLLTNDRNEINNNDEEPRQYPENPGYHGTDDEEDLNPEE